MARTLLFLLSSIFLFISPVQAASDSYEDERIRIQLITEYDAFSREGDNWIGLLMEPAEGWHVYWQNPGDSGLPPSISFDSSTKSSIGEILWPTPEKIPFPPLTNYGYHHVLLSMPLHVQTTTQQNIDLSANANWLVCKEACIPGSAQLTLSRPIKTKEQLSPSSDQNLFIETRAQVPAPLGVLSATHSKEKEKFVLELYARSKVFDAVKSLEVFPVTTNLVDNTSVAESQHKGNRLYYSTDLSPYFSSQPDKAEFILKLSNGKNWRVLTQAK